MNPAIDPAEVVVKPMSRDAIEVAAKSVLKMHGLFFIPVDPVTLANRSGIRVHNAVFSDENLSGAIAKRKGATTILINQNDAPARKRFTIAHELGHHFLHLSECEGEFVDGSADFYRDEEGEHPDNRRRAEVQANLFAAALLMPQELLEAQSRNTRSVPQLAQMFGVSEEAMGYRLARLGFGYEQP